MGGKQNENTLPRTKKNTKFLTVKEKQVNIFLKWMVGIKLPSYLDLVGYILKNSFTVLF